MLVMAAPSSSSVGVALLPSKALTAMIIPDWQYPHCGTWSLIQAACTAVNAGAPMPSIVVICAFAAALTGRMQLRVGLPFRCTVQAPQAPIPQPNFVPLSPSSSRMTHSKGASGSTSIR